MKVYDGASWITATSAGATSLIRFRYVATSGQTTFSGADAASATLTYTVNNIVVMRNGVTLDTSEYTASNGTSIVLGVAAGTGDIVDIVAFKSFTVADALSAVSGGTVNGAVTITGVTTVQAGTAAAPAITTTGDTNTGIFFPAADTIAFAEGGAEVARFDSAGNFGLGVTPSAWSAGYVGFQVKNASLASYTSGAFTWVGSNWYNNSGNKYIGTGFATLYEQTDGKHAWLTAASGTAGNAISFTQAMTLSAGGLLSVGTTNASGATIRGNGASNANAYYYLDANGPFGGSASYSSILGFALYTDTGARYNSQAEITCVSDGNYSGSLTFSTQNPGTYPNPVTERARITSDGNLLVGTTSAGGNKFRVNSAGRAGAFHVTAASTTATESLALIKFDNNSTTAQIFQVFYINDGANTCGQINANGANNAAFGSTSDSRLKENIVDLPSQLSSIMALRPVEFDYIESEGGGHQIGFVAQEMQAVYSDTVGERKDGMLMVTGWSKTEARLVKAIQEQQALITTLTARITALEGA